MFWSLIKQKMTSISKFRNSQNTILKVNSQLKKFSGIFVTCYAKIIIKILPNLLKQRKICFYQKSAGFAAWEKPVRAPCLFFFK